jgi:hypothetical protein
MMKKDHGNNRFHSVNSRLIVIANAENNLTKIIFAFNGVFLV